MTAPPSDSHYQTLMHRAWKNYEFIRAHKTDDGPFEVTQLLATFMIAVAHPRERQLRRELNDLAIDDAVGWFGLPRLVSIEFEPGKRRRTPPLVAEERDFDPTAYLGDQIEILRHAIAHGNIVFSQSGTTEDVREIVLLNIQGNRERDTVTVTFDELEEYTRVCITIADHFFEVRDLTRQVLDMMFADDVETGTDNHLTGEPA